MTDTVPPKKDTPAENEPWTIGRLLTWTADYLKKHGSESPRLDAEVLLAHARGCERIELYTAFNDDPGEEVRVAFREMVRRRAEATPVAYLVGHKEFYSLDFRVTPDVLIPRPETELLVVQLLDKAKELSRSELHIADVGTGSGILAVCAAKHLPQASVTAIDISEAALAIAKENAVKHGVDERLEFIEGDLFASVPTETTFDFVVSNPPYVSDSEYESLAKTVQEHEPKLALTSGPRGTEIIERLIPQAAERVAPGGYLMIEFSPMIADDVLKLVRADGSFEEPELVRDLNRQSRVVVTRKN